MRTPDTAIRCLPPRCDHDGGGAKAEEASPRPRGENGEHVLTTLNVDLKTAVDWKVLGRMPCTIRLLPVPISDASFLHFDEYDALLQGEASQPDAYLVALLGGDAGLCCGEMMALAFTDINVRRSQLCIQRSDWRGEVTVPKGGRLR